MTSHRPPHIEASSTIPTGSNTEKPHARNLSVDQSASAATKKTALSDLSDTLMEQIVDMRNVEKAWRKVKANKGAPGPDGIRLDEFPQRFRAEWPTIRQQLLDGTYAPQPARRKSIGIGNRKGNRFGSRKGNRSVGQVKGHQVKMGKLQERAYSYHLEGSCRCSIWKTTN